MAIDIFEASIQKRMDEFVFRRALSNAPFGCQERVLRYRRWEDGYLHLFGRHLLSIALSTLFGIDSRSVLLYYEASGRPYLKLEVDFSIAHSGTRVLCAICNDRRIGLDVEVVREVDIDLVDMIFDNQQKSEWMASGDQATFFLIFGRKVKLF